MLIVEGGPGVLQSPNKSAPAKVRNAEPFLLAVQNEERKGSEQFLLKTHWTVRPVCLSVLV